MIEITNLSKKYGTFHALKDISLHIEKGTVFGFVGPNGAGKSTTMSILATLMLPTSGVAKVGGYDVTQHPKEVRKRIGYMPDFFGVYDQLKSTEYLHFYGASYGIPRVEREQLIPQLLELVNLSDKADTYVDSLSRGMKQRLCLARCLVHDPDVLILDEPASGLDPRARIEMREILKELKLMGKTIIISSHILPELAEMVDEIGVIEHGEMVAQGKVADIQSRLRVKKVIHIRTLEREEELAEKLRDEPFVTSVLTDNTGVHVHYSGDDAQQSTLLRQVVSWEIPIVSFQEAQSNLEDVFLEITKGGPRE
ncbi:ABC transporter ATP-binding protein [Paenibacillus glucanolyticus]|jgi:ABC-2 type transport system ATP-binding protein|uniref:ABC transporter ATP-binding protein n=1 Tax=Paenibacillus TaxID=44249 RepID=UPI0003E213CC|nr:MULTISPECIES: ABC transporter ATP-binding protein [Paenibacillus]ANA79175.1 ABC transporter [Paenibacillus glucanolyticus]AVV56895.1 ABC transporter ATP-binding protein [Paenibacillus glucanolyticus]ETT33591.1 ABC transporter-like protein [Paenibacillus sp. FSL R5-808]MPY18508.1 ABC transporter ATP-binding protein [Paenibacillus glucanolyticus]OMF78188.1 ABC transporter [Paenibacillus glucanolyticus]